MKAQVIFSSELKSGTSKKTGKPYEGYFVDLLVKEDSGDLRFLNNVGYLDKSLVGKQLPEDTMVELSFNYRGFIESVKILKDEPPFMVRG